MTADRTEPTIIHLPARVREALGGIAAARGVPVETLVERVLENAVAAEARWRRYPGIDPPGRPPCDVRQRRRAGDRSDAPMDPNVDQPGAEGGAAPSR